MRGKDAKTLEGHVDDLRAGRGPKPKDAGRLKDTLTGWPAKVAKIEPKGHGCKDNLGKVLVLTMRFDCRYGRT